MVKLKMDDGFLRYNDRSSKKKPVVPLTEEEKQYLEKECYEYCKKAYKRRMVKSGLVDKTEDLRDLDHDSYVFFHNILIKFDKKYYVGSIGEFDVEGKDQPKTLKRYFQWYFSTRVQFIAMETRKAKKLKGIGPASVIDDVSYDEEYSGEFTEYNYKYNATGFIFSELGKKDDDFKRFFKEHVEIGMSQKELKEEWGGNYNRLKQEFIKFKTEIRKKYGEVYKNKNGDD